MANIVKKPATAGGERCVCSAPTHLGRKRILEIRATDHAKARQLLAIALGAVVIGAG